MIRIQDVIIYIMLFLQLRRHCQIDNALWLLLADLHSGCVDFVYVGAQGYDFPWRVTAYVTYAYYAGVGQTSQAYDYICEKVKITKLQHIFIILSKF